MESFKNLFFLFMFYSFLGWVVEVIKISFASKKFINRGFLIGPFCPIYGIGCVAITVLLKNSVNDFSELFLKSIFICSILEYFTSYIMEKIFKYRWWDYSKRKFNINGRICLETMIPFGLGACFIVYFVNPILFKIILSMNNVFSTILFIILFTSLILDLALSSILISKIKGIEKNARIDSTERLNKKIKSKIKKYGIFYKRIFESFPDLIIIKKRKDKKKHERKRL